jgi:pimeloyl-ACP methyl ester carboxylesterase
VLIAILVLVVVLLAASVVLSRSTREVQSARDTEYLELEGNWIRYRVAGGGPPVVLVHGWLSSGRIWEDLAGRLAQRFTVYTLDLSGFGESDKPLSGYGVRYGSRLLYAFCAHFGLTRATVVGHDVGGVMAVKLAADHPDVVSRIVLVATPADEDQIDLPTLLWFATLPVVGPVFYALGRLLRPLRRLWMRPFVLEAEDLTEEIVDDAGNSTPAAVKKTLEVTRREISGGRLVRQAGIIKVPVLTIAGEDDQIVDPQATDAWARALSAEVVLLDGCGHLPMLERTGEFNARVLAFLTGDARYLDTIATPQRETPEEDEDPTTEDPTTEEPPERQYPFARAEPETTDEPEASDPPNIVRKRHGRYPPRDRDSARDSEGDRQGPGDAEVRREDSPSSAEGNGVDENTRDRRERRTRGDVDGPLPELPGHLFEWPELKDPRPWNRGDRETGRRAWEEREEGVDPKDPREDPPREDPPREDPPREEPRT